MEAILVQKNYNRFINSVKTFLGLHSMKLFAITMIFVLSIGFIPYFEQHVFFSFLCFVLFNISMIVDIISAIMLAKIRGGGFETNKAMKAMIKIAAYNYVLIFFNRVSDMFGESGISVKLLDGLKAVTSEEVAVGVATFFGKYHFSPFAVWLYAFIIISLSCLKNFQLADAFQSLSKFDRWIYINVDMYKNADSDRLWFLMNEEQKWKAAGKNKK